MNTLTGRSDNSFVRRAAGLGPIQRYGEEINAQARITCHNQCRDRDRRAWQEIVALRAVSCMKVNRQDIHADRQPGVNSDRWKRLAWWLVAGVPMILALGMVLSESRHFADLDQQYDVSSRCLLWSGAFLVAVGLAMAVMAIRRGRRAWEEVQEGSADSDRQAQLGQVREARLRSAWLIIVAIGISALGACTVWLSAGEPSATP